MTDQQPTPDQPDGKQSWKQVDLGELLRWQRLPGWVRASAFTLLGMILGSAAAGSPPPAEPEPAVASAAEVVTETATEVVTETVTETVTERATPTPEPEPEPEAEPEPEQEPDAGETVPQQNARRSAESYLTTQAFSKRGLIQQLEFEGYSTADAKYAVNHVDVDWREQAARKAESYLETQAFSRSGLIGQLEFEGFTTKQATYGVDQVGL